MRTLLHLTSTGRQYWVRTRQGWQVLSGEPNTDYPVWVVTDLAEESFAEIEIPRLYGRDRSDLIARQLVNRFPDTPYRSRLDIDHGGKLLDRIVPTRFTLFGITAAEKLNTELDASGISVAGMCPTSLLLTRIGQHKQLPADLFIVLPSPGALRIVFLKNRIPVLTRLAPLPDQVAAQAEEIVRTHRYLENVRTLQRGTKPPPVLILGNAGEFAAPLAAAKLELVAPPPPWNTKPPGDWRFPLFDLAIREQPYGQLAPLARRTVYVARRLHKGALAAAVASIVIGLLASSSNVLDILDILRDKESMQAASQRVNTQVSAIEQRIASFGAPPDLVRRAVALNEDEIVAAPAIDKHLQLISHVLDGQTNLRLANLEWHLLAGSATPCAGHLAPAPNSGPAPEAAPANAEANPERKVELVFELTLPESMTPRGRVQALRNISTRLSQIKGATLLQDPAKELTRGTLRGGAVLAGEENKSIAWCLTLPGSTKPSSTKDGAPQS